MAHTIYKNNSETLVVGNVSAVSVIITVADGTQLPSPAAGEIVYATMRKAVTLDNEVISYTSLVGNTISGITRNVSGTGALTFVSNDLFQIRIPNTVLSEFIQRQGTEASGGNRIIGNLEWSAANAPAIVNENASAINPVLIPDRTNIAGGVGSGATPGDVSLIGAPADSVDDDGHIVNLTGGIGGSNTGDGGAVLITTGDSPNDDSGDLILTVGTAGGTPGVFKFLRSGVPSVSGQVWTASAVDGTGYWAAASAASLTDVDGDTLIQLEESADEDILRVDVGDTPAGFGAVPNIMTLASSGWTVAMGIANVATTVGAPINIDAGQGNTTGDGGTIDIDAGQGGADGDGGILTIRSGAGGSSTGAAGNLILATGAVTSGTIGNILFERNSLTQWQITSNGFETNAATGPRLVLGLATDTVPSLLHNRSATTTGVGGVAGEVSLIVSGSNKFRATSTLTTFSNPMESNFVQGAKIMGAVSSATVPTLIPNKSAGDTTGIGGAVNNVNVILGGVNYAEFSPTLGIDIETPDAASGSTLDVTLTVGDAQPGATGIGTLRIEGGRSFNGGNLAGGPINVTAGSGSGTFGGGAVNITGGQGGATGGIGGNAVLRGAAGGGGGGTGGGAQVLAGNAGVGAGDGGQVTITSGNASFNQNGDGGDIDINAGNAGTGTGLGQGGDITIDAGDGGVGGTGVGGQINITTGAAGSVVSDSGDLILETAAGGATSGVSGDVTINTGTAGGTVGDVIIQHGGVEQVRVGVSGVALAENLTLTGDGTGNIFLADDVSALSISGGDAANTGSQITFYGSTHGTFADDMDIDADVLNLRAQDGTAGWTVETTQILAANAAGPAIVNEAVTGTNPTLIPNRTDLDSGVGWEAADQTAIISGGVQAVRYEEASSEIIQVVSGDFAITASTTQSQGQQPLLSSYNVVTTVANANDVVTLPSAAAGRLVSISNAGANSLQVFPASGDFVNNQAVDTSFALGVGLGITLLSQDAATWRTI